MWVNLLQIYCFYLNDARKKGEKFYKVSYNQGFCSLLDIEVFLKKKSQYPADDAEYCDFDFLFIRVYSILSSIDFNT